MLPKPGTYISEFFDFEFIVVLTISLKNSFPKFRLAVFFKLPSFYAMGTFFYNGLKKQN